jgi:NADH-quinone oxidoreductase subunit L
MKIAMGVLAVGAVGLGALQIPGVTEVVHKFLEPTFADSAFYDELHPSDTASWIGIVVGTLIAFAGIALAYRLYVQDREAPARIRTRLAGLHRVFVNKWYFDEAIDLVIVRPFAWFGRFARNTFERVFVNGVLVGGPSGVVRAGSAAVRAIQSGFLRAYAALLLLGLAALGLYFLISAS